jgi:hypothetical protein
MSKSMLKLPIYTLPGCSSPLQLIATILLGVTKTRQRLTYLKKFIPSAHRALIKAGLRRAFTPAKPSILSHSPDSLYILLLESCGLDSRVVLNVPRTSLTFPPEFISDKSDEYLESPYIHYGECDLLISFSPVFSFPLLPPYSSFSSSFSSSLPLSSSFICTISPILPPFHLTLLYTISLTQEFNNSPRTSPPPRKAALHFHARHNRLQVRVLRGRG